MEKSCLVNKQSIHTATNVNGYGMRTNVLSIDVPVT